MKKTLNRTLLITTLLAGIFYMLLFIVRSDDANGSGSIQSDSLHLNSPQNTQDLAPLLSLTRQDM